MNVPTAVSQTTLSDVFKSYGDHPVLERVDLSIPAAEKVGVVGENGSGKSTLLRLIAGRELPDSGEVTVLAAGGIGHVGQTLGMSGDHTVADVIDRAFARLRDMQRRIAEFEAGFSETEAESQAADLAEYGELLTEFEARGGYQADARVATAMHALGLPDIAADRRLNTLSGGEQSRLGLATMLAADPELLLLDEPTNHLDTAGVDWLITRLRTHRGTVIAVTHDRRFLAGFAQSIVDVDADTCGVNRYGNGWDGYLTAKAAARQRWEQRYRAWAAELARHDAAVDAGASRLAAQVRSDTRPRTAGHRRSHESGLSAVVRNAHERLRRLKENPVPRPPDPLRFTGSFGVGEPAAESGDVHCELIDVGVSDRLKVSRFRLNPGDRVFITGANGAGKTTLLRVLAGDLAPDTGSVTVPGRVGYLPQELPESATERSVLAEFAAGYPGEPEEYAGRLRDLGLLAERDFAKPVAALSVGQRRRLELAKLVTRPHRLLILDEPTNHLSPALVSELETALTEYTGSLVVVSHDAEFARGFAAERMRMESGVLVSQTTRMSLNPARISGKFCPAG